MVLTLSGGIPLQAWAKSNTRRRRDRSDRISFWVFLKSFSASVRRPQSQYGFGQMRCEPCGDCLLLAMIEQPGGNDGDSNQRQCEGKQQRVLEYHVGEVAEINGNADHTEYRISASHQ